jgi:hypothetical protein
MKKIITILLCLPMIGFGQSWKKTFTFTTGSAQHRGYSVQQTSDGGYIITGHTNSFGGVRVYLIKTNSQDNITSTFNIPIPNPNRKLQKAVDILGRETKQNKPINHYSISMMMEQ